jgi:hypothetical protein
MKKIQLLIVAFLITTALSAQDNPAQTQDTVIVNLGKTSKIIFTVEDPEDLEVLQHYNFQLLFEDILRKLEEKKRGDVAGDSVNEEVADANENEEVVIDEEETQQEHDEDVENESDGDEHGDDGDDHHHHHKHGKWHRTWQTFNFDLGTNNYLQDRKIPSDNEAFAVRPWGSWYVGLSSIQRSRIGKKFFLEWGLGASWYTFKFEHDNTLIEKGENGVTFTLDTREVDFEKSKLSVSYIHASLVPVLDFGDRGRKARVWDGHNEAFRIGVGPYVGYRISSSSKVVYEDDGRERDKDRDGFFINNFRYGMRLQVGYRSTDLFFNYDMNELFQENKGPKLNAFSFGVIF